METQVFVNLNNSMPRPQATMASRKRKPCGCGKQQRGSGLGNAITQIAQNFENFWPYMIGPVGPTVAAYQYVFNNPAPPTSVSDVLKNALPFFNTPITQNEANELSAQTASQQQQACGTLAQTNPTLCSQLTQQAQQAVTAAAQQSNQQLAGPPYSYVLAAENYLNNLTLPSLPSLPSWVWWAAVALGFVLIYEAA